MLGATQTGSVSLQATFATEAELQGYLLAGAYPAGWQVYVVSTDKYYTYYPAGTTKGGLAAQAGLVVVPTTGGGAFVVGTTGIVQSAYAEIAIATTVAVAAGLTDLLTIPITTLGGDLEILFTACSFNNQNNGATLYELWLDGANIGPGTMGTGQFSPGANEQFGVAIEKKKSGVAAGAHTVKVRWKAFGAGSTSTIDPTATMHGSLSVSEVNR